MRRDGLSLIELLLALLIVVLIVGLLLPALTRHRWTSGERNPSMNHLKQIALACHNYNDAYAGKLPPLTDIGTGAPNGAGLNSLFFNILPYIEEDNIFRLFKKATPSTYYRTSASAGSLLGASSHNVRVYRSPADLTAVYGTTRDVSVNLPFQPAAPFAASFTGRYATTSYAANGLVFGDNNAGLLESFKDGTSNTIMFAERPQICQPATGPPVYNLWGFGMYGPSTPAFALLTPAMPAGLPSTGQIVPVLPLPAAGDPLPVRIGIATADPVPSPLTIAFQTPNDRACDPRIPRTPHVGSMLVALGDGSVRSLDSKISMWTFWAACTPAGHETLGPDW